MEEFMTVHPKVAAFCERFQLDLPVLLAPMAGVPAPTFPLR